MPETEPKKRGRPRKSEGQNSSEPEQTSVTPEPETTQAALNMTEVPTEHPVERATHRFMKNVYKEGSDILTALSTAQDELFAGAGVFESFYALNSMATLGLEAARERNEQGLIETLTSKQRAFSSALRRLSPLEATGGVAPVPTNPSSLPPMTGRKG